mmetsp:Transcript_89671/g.208898  ORF Transcript_89671/g.208898 Transcript_89671/m.208898 type:complete len:234 (-) Transcript_89671:548-1249(-)
MLTLLQHYVSLHKAHLSQSLRHCTLLGVQERVEDLNALKQCLISVYLLIGNLHEDALEVCSIYDPNTGFHSCLHCGSTRHRIHQSKLTKAAARLNCPNFLRWFQGRFLPPLTRCCAASRAGGLVLKIDLVGIRNENVEPPTGDNIEEFCPVIPLFDDLLILLYLLPPGAICQLPHLLLVQPQRLQVLVAHEIRRDEVALLRCLARDWRIRARSCLPGACSVHGLSFCKLQPQV